MLALLGMGKWLLKKINATLDSYVVAYAHQTANIDARIANLEKLAQEQAHLTRTVERIKDEIAAQAKSRDNLWEFRKEVYVNLLTDLEEIVALNFTALDCANKGQPIPAEYTQKLYAAVKQFSISANLAPLAASDDLLPLVKSVLTKLKDLFDPALPFSNESFKSINEIFLELRERVQAAGRKDLWGTRQPDAKVDAAT